jgi:Single-strand binding protein family
MSDRAIVSGFLFGAPATKTSKAGKPYIIATIRSGSGETGRFWQCFGFSHGAIASLSSLADGNPVAVSGEFSCDIYTPSRGVSRLTWKIVADAVLSTSAEEVRWYKD